jgi:peptide deformylase
VVVRAIDVDGSPVEREMTGIAARAVQHELDHLDGVLVIERFSAIRRNLLRGQLRKIRKEGVHQEPGLVALEPGTVGSQR